MSRVSSSDCGRRERERGTTMRISLSGFPRLFRQLEQEIETVIRVLEPGPLGIMEHKFSADEIRQANATVLRAVDNWRRNAILEQKIGILDDFIQK